MDKEKKQQKKLEIEKDKELIKIKKREKSNRYRLKKMVEKYELLSSEKIQNPIDSNKNITDSESNKVEDNLDTSKSFENEENSENDDYRSELNICTTEPSGSINDSTSSSEESLNYNNADDDNENENENIEEWNSFGLNHKQLFPDSNVQIIEYFIAIFAFKIKHNLNDATITDLLKLIRILIPNSNDCPKTMHYIETIFSKYNNFKAIQHQYCTNCNIYVSTNECNKCKKCSNILIHFVTFDFISQIESILKKKSLLLEILKTNRLNLSKTTQFPIESCFDGSLYRQSLQNKAIGENLISINLNSDGAPMVKSKSYSVWPVLGVCLKLPQKIRESFRNTILLGNILLTFFVVF
jgi:hypothetical protein